jgi:integrase
VGEVSTSEVYQELRADREDGCRLGRQRIYLREWNYKFIDMPKVDKKTQKSMCFTDEVVTGIVRVTQGLYRIPFILCAAAGLRIGEVLGLDIKDISQR